MRSSLSMLFTTAIALGALACGSVDDEGDDQAGENDGYLCSASSGGLNLCANYYGEATAEQRRQLGEQSICRFEPCSETRPEVCGQVDGMNECREVRALGRCDVPNGEAMGLEAIALTKVEQVFYDATAYRGMVILYTKRDAEESCATLGGQWFDRYTAP